MQVRVLPGSNTFLEILYKIEFAPSYVYTPAKKGCPNILFFSSIASLSIMQSVLIDDAHNFHSYSFSSSTELNLGLNLNLIDLREISNCTRSKDIDFKLIVSLWVKVIHMNMNNKDIHTQCLFTCIL